MCMIICILSMTVLLQTRVPRELAARFKSAARAKGKSSYQVLRELAADYANLGPRRQFVSEGYTERFGLPSPAGFKDELRWRMQRRNEKHH
jgi:hypothetical protein